MSTVLVVGVEGNGGGVVGKFLMSVLGAVEI